MPKPKAIHWPAIKTGYLNGRKPKDLATEYGLTPEQISQKAKREKWKTEKTKISQEIQKTVVRVTRTVAELALLATEKALKNYLEGETSKEDLFILKAALQLAYPKEAKTGADEAPKVIGLPGVDLDAL